jgi:hypothetical protein
VSEERRNTFQKEIEHDVNHRGRGNDRTILPEGVSVEKNHCVVPEMDKAIL